MELFEIGSNFSQIWNTFFWPFFESIIIILITAFVMGKDNLNSINELFIEQNNTFYIKHKGIYVPLNKSKKHLIKLLQQSPIVTLIAILVFVYSLNKFIDLVAQLFPITYYFRPDNLLLYSTDEHILASIWSYCPTLPFSNLYNQIEMLTKDSDNIFNSFSSMYFHVGNLCKFLMFASVVLFFTPKKIIISSKKRKAILLFLCAMTVLSIINLYNFNCKIKETEQRCYLALSQHQLDNSNYPIDNEEYINCLDKVLKEKEFFNKNAYEDIRFEDIFVYKTYKLSEVDKHEIFGIKIKYISEIEKIIELIKNISFFPKI